VKKITIQLTPTVFESSLHDMSSNDASVVDAPVKKAKMGMELWKLNLKWKVRKDAMMCKTHKKGSARGVPYWEPLEIVLESTKDHLSVIYQLLISFAKTQRMKALQKIYLAFGLYAIH
jgi:hypothetical protein